MTKAKKKIKKKTKTKKSRKTYKKYLVIVESPAKSRTIEKYLGKDFKVMSSMGHLRDLPKSKLAIDVENNFEPHYIIVKGKAKILKPLKEAAKNAEIVYLAPDPDREGEAIAWHLSQALEVSADKIKRIEFNEITKKAVSEALQKPRQIDMARVNAQQARRLLDRLVGYKISPLLWKKVQRGLSAGRVQSVAVRIICDREAEIEKFKSEEYWTIDGEFKTEKAVIKARLNSSLEDGQKVVIKNQAESDRIIEELNKSSYIIKDVRRREKRRNPNPPFITSTLQQESSRKLGFNTRKTMIVAQQLYEGVSLTGGEATGLITYMRTDSTRIADIALNNVRQFISKKFGADQMPGQPNIYKLKKSAQDAHEAIRPTDVFLEPNNIKQFLTPDQYKIYSLIWKRFVASQMIPALLDITTADIVGNKYLLRSAGSIIKEKGFRSVYLESTDDNGQGESEVVLPELVAGEKLSLLNLLPEQHFTQPPPRFTEASLIKILEEKGIGRPSTYAPIISTILMRNYVNRERKRLNPTELGRTVDEQLKKHFPKIVDIDFTAIIENNLDQIIEGSVDWHDVLRDFYFPFAEKLKQAEINMEDLKVKDEPTDEKCEKCGKPMVIKVGRYGKFLACSGFPECRNTKTIIKPLEVPCPACGGSLVKKRTKQGRIFIGCADYPKCNFACWEEPILPPEYCPKCKAFMVEVKKKGQPVQKLCIMCDIKNLESKNEQKETNHGA